MEENKDLRQDEKESVEGNMEENKETAKETTESEEKKTAVDEVPSPIGEAEKEENPIEEKASTNAVEGSIHDLSDTKPAEEVPDQIDGEYHPVNVPSAAPTVFNPIRYHNDKTHTIDEDLESIRKGYAQKIGKSSLFNIASMVVMLISFVAVLVVSLVNNDENLAWVTWVVFAIAIVLIVASFVTSHFVYKKASKINIEYLTVYQDALSGYLAEKLDIQDPVFSAEAKLDDQDAIQTHYFKTITAISSRCVLRGTRRNRPLETGECLIIMPDRTFEDCNRKPENLTCLDGTKYVPEVSQQTTSTQELPATDMTMIDLDLADELSSSTKEKSKREKEQGRARRIGREPTATRNGLFGRLVAYRIRIDPEESFIISFMGNKENTVLPDYVDNFTPVHVDGLKKNIVVYLADVHKGGKFFDEEGVRLLNEITPDSIVQSLFLSANSYGVKVGMNLSDDIMELPMRKPVRLGCVDTFVSTSGKVFDFIDYVETKATVLDDDH